jgi:hypothetical protein
MDLNATITRGIRSNRSSYINSSSSTTLIDDKSIETVTMQHSPETNDLDDNNELKTSVKRRSSSPFMPSKNLGSTSTNPLRRSVIFSMLAYDINAKSEVLLNASSAAESSKGSEGSSIEIASTIHTHQKKNFVVNNNQDDYNNSGKRRLSASGNDLARSFMTSKMSASSPAAPDLSPQTVQMRKANTMSRLRMLAWEREGDQHYFEKVATDWKNNNDDDDDKDTNSEDNHEKTEDRNVKFLGLSSDSSDSSGFGADTPLISMCTESEPESVLEPVANQSSPTNVLCSGGVDAPSPMNPTDVRRFASVRDRLHAVNPLRTTPTALLNTNTAQKPPLFHHPVVLVLTTRRPSLTSPGSPPRLNRPKGDGIGSSTHSSISGLSSSLSQSPQLATCSLANDTTKVAPSTSSTSIADVAAAAVTAAVDASIDGLATAYERAFRISVRSTLARASIDTNVCSSWDKSTSSSSSSSPVRSFASSVSSSMSYSDALKNTRRFSLPTNGLGWKSEATLTAAELVHAVSSPTRTFSIPKQHISGTECSCFTHVAEKVISDNLESKLELKKFIEEIASQRGRQAVAKHLCETSSKFVYD